MIWLVWRQHRQQVLFALLGLAALAAFMIPTGIQMHAAFDRAGLDDCVPAAAQVDYLRANPNSNVAPFGADPSDPVTAQVTLCQEQAGLYAGRLGLYGTVGILLWFLPLLAGIFWGAPLVAREVEHGTHRLVWTQGVTRRRWALVKFSLVGGGLVLVAACYSVLMTWWRAPLDQAAAQRFQFLLFDLIGIVPIAYTLFAFALGTFAGALTRKTQVAGAITLVGFTAARLGVEFLARSHYLAPLRRTYPILVTKLPNPISGDWLLSSGVYSAQGARVAGGTFTQFVFGGCPPPPAGAQCLAQYGGITSYTMEVFQPAERFWLFQGIETALFTAVAVGLLLAAVRWARRLT